MKRFILFSLFSLICGLSTFASVKVGGIYYNLDENSKVAEITSGTQKYAGSVSIPERIVYDGVVYTVTSIGNHAFQYCSDLTSVTIPNSVTSIGISAFYDCI